MSVEVKTMSERITITATDGEKYEVCDEMFFSWDRRVEFIGRPAGSDCEPRRISVQWAVVTYDSSGEQITMEATQ
jgi:hypothetical protein